MGGGVGGGRRGVGVGGGRGVEEGEGGAMTDKEGDETDGRVTFSQYCTRLHQTCM